MTATAVTAEYNPFHNGHRHHINASKSKTNADYIITVMSGNFVQRGDFALLRKHQRARAAVESGSARRCGSTASRPHGTTRASPRRSGGRTRRISSSTAAR